MRSGSAILLSVALLATTCGDSSSGERSTPTTTSEGESIEQEVEIPEVVVAPLSRQAELRFALRLEAVERGVWQAVSISESDFELLEDAICSQTAESEITASAMYVLNNQADLTGNGKAYSLDESAIIGELVHSLLCAGYA